MHLHLHTCRIELNRVGIRCEFITYVGVCSVYVNIKHWYTLRLFLIYSWKVKGCSTSFYNSVLNCLSTSLTDLKRCKLSNRDEEGMVSLQYITPDFFFSKAWQLVKFQRSWMFWIQRDFYDPMIHSIKRTKISLNSFIFFKKKILIKIKSESPTCASRKF